MFNSSTILKALPSFWQDRFEDKNILETLYSYVGEYLSDVYRSGLEPLSSLAFQATPEFTFKTWNILRLSDVNRLYIDETDPDSLPTIVYGMIEQDFVMQSCSRLYKSPTLKGDYLVNTKHFSILDFESQEIQDLIATSENSPFFDRFNRFIVFFGIDPLFLFENQEPETSLVSYPLVFKIQSSFIASLSDDDLEGRAITINIDSDVSVSTTILTSIRDTEFTEILVDPSAFTEFIDDRVITVEGITDSPVRVSILDSYLASSEEFNVWAFDCEIDEFSLHKRWGHLLADSINTRIPIRSSERYKLVLEAMLRARMLGLSSTNLAYLANIILGSGSLGFSSRNDVLLTVDLVNKRLLTDLTEYPLINILVINHLILENCESILLSGSKILTKDCISLTVNDASVFHTIKTELYNRGPNVIELSSAGGDLIGKVIVASTNNRVIVYLNPDYTFDRVSQFSVALADSTQITLLSNTYSITDLYTNIGFTDDTIINPLVRVVDINNGLTDWYNSGLILPRNIWDVPESSRREISTDLYPHVIGEMPLHRIGDYELFIPSAENVAAFDSPNVDNPSGHAWVTAYKLSVHFLTTKIALLIPDAVLPTPDFSFTLSLVNKVIDNSKLLLTLVDGTELVVGDALPINSTLTELVPAVTDTVAIEYSERSPGDNLDTAATPTETLVEEVILPVDSILQETAATPSAALNVENIITVESTISDSTNSPTDSLTIETI